MYNYNFFQSKLRKTINKEIYKKYIFEIQIGNKTFRGIEKTQKKGTFKFSWYQLLGIKLEDLGKDEDQIQNTLNNIKKIFKTRRGDIFFQLGFINVIGIFNSRLFKDRKILKLIREERENQNKQLNKIGLIPSFRENMPKATVLIDLDQSETQLYKNLSPNARNHYNKAIRKKLYFQIADKKDWNIFYILWQQTSLKKGFHIIPKKQFENLRDFLLNTNSGNLFLAKKEKEIVSGSICLFDEKFIIYLYGATNREFGNIGAHQFLKLEMFKRCKKNGFLQVDLLGTPSFIENNSQLYGVGKFKWSLGGKQIEYLGSYDLIFNKSLYQIFKIKRKLQKLNFSRFIKF